MSGLEAIVVPVGDGLEELPQSNTFFYDYRATRNTAAATIAH